VAAPALNHAHFASEATLSRAPNCLLKPQSWDGVIAETRDGVAQLEQARAHMAGLAIGFHPADQPVGVVRDVIDARMSISRSSRERPSTSMLSTWIAGGCSISARSPTPALSLNLRVSACVESIVSGEIDQRLSPLIAISTNAETVRRLKAFGLMVKCIFS
jgi:hypothetical protein